MNNSRHIIVFGAGRSSAALINYLKRQVIVHSWKLIVADSNPEAAREKIGSSPGCEAVAVNVNDPGDRAKLVSSADLVISLLPPALHYLVAVECLRYKKHLLTASYADADITALASAADSAGVLFLCEMGLDPGIDHMSAMQLVHRIQKQDGKVLSFKSHCGGLVAPESDDNPWHYKISWNPANVVSAGMKGALYRQDFSDKKISYPQVFSRCPEIYVEDIGNLAWYPNRDSLQYMQLYGLSDARDFIRTTLRHPDFCVAWNCLVNAELTDSQAQVIPGIRFRDWSLAVSGCMNEMNRKPLEFLGLFDEAIIPENLNTSARTLQYLLEKKLMLQQHDRDMVVMVHELEYVLREKTHRLTSSLVLKGEDQVHTAMSKTVGLPLGIAAMLILTGQIRLKGLHIPILPVIYEPVLNQLELEGISFREVDKMM